MIKRRDFLKIAGASGSAVVMEGCSRAPVEKLIPYLVAPDDIVPGMPAHYATVCRECPAGCGLLAKTREGRVIKVEGNPHNPVGGGGLCVRGQASLQSLYNPDRFRGPYARDGRGELRPVTWDQAETTLTSALRRLKREGRGSRIAWIGSLLTGSLERLTREWLQALGSERRLFYETFQYESLRRAAELAFGRAEIPAYHLEEANFLVSFGADFLETWLSNVELARAFSHMRKKRPHREPDNFVHISPRLSLTGSNADWWIPITPGAEVFLALSMAHAMIEQGWIAAGAKPHLRWIKELITPFSPASMQEATGVSPSTVRELARRFYHASPSLALGGGVSAGGDQAVSTELAVMLLNVLAGNVGKTVSFGAQQALDNLASYRDVLALTEDMKQQKIDLLFLHHCNPVFTLPASSGFSEALEKVPLVVSFSSAPDEATARAHLVLPDHHFLESWGDYTPRAGILGFQQPAMPPILDTRATGELLLRLARNIDSEIASQFDWPSYGNWVQSYWNSVVYPQLMRQEPWEEIWPAILKSGGHFSSSEPSAVSLRDFSRDIHFVRERLEGADDGLALVVYPSVHFFDGRNANNPWLQEIPDPVTKIVWGGWLELHPETAQKLGLEEGDVVELHSPYGRLKVAAHLYSGLHRGVVAMPLGQGRGPAGLRYASGRGDNPSRLLSPKPDPTSGSMLWRSVRVTLSKSGQKQEMVRLQVQTQPVTPVSDLIGLDHNPMSEKRGAEHRAPVDFYPPHSHPEHRWAMAIDLDSCVGCNACVAACYAENNVPVVGKERCAEGREMSWIRIEKYEQPSQAHDIVRPGVSSLPMLCQQCDQAPCEPVCPVYATYHNPEGLNAQVYNRCVGTRYCGNNCPYKVRRFNWASYSFPEPLHLQLNPDVTVRTAGVMEKCTFCIQRIQQGKNIARREGRAVRDGDITTACAQSCPAEAIVFGDLTDPKSKVAALAKDLRGYRVLDLLNTRPAVTYLKKIVSNRPFSET
ncbi:MAG: molybdopterin-dependent oxidoreductase [Acidobacteria bacterium]|nr:molybdopterin-dependent oxidoreductase [Acidobacteriota bacterium]